MLPVDLPPAPHPSRGLLHPARLYTSRVPIVDLTRTVRCCIDPSEPDARLRSRLAERPLNSFAAFPSSDALTGSARYFEFDVRCRGEIDPATGYFLNIKDIDAAFRDAVVPRLAALLRSPDHADRSPQSVLPDLFHALNAALDRRVRALVWRLTPFLRAEADMNPSQPAQTRVAIRQQFDFSAAHRLHAPSLSDADNRRVFGKCNLPSGHGHNYRVEPCVDVPAGAAAPGFQLSDLERLTAETIIERFDHKHLNLDCPEFNPQASPPGLNPSVENIAMVCYNLLAPRIDDLARHGKPARLRCVTVWETEKTSATFPAP